MSLSDSIQIRLNIDQMKRLEIEAARKGKPLAAFIREIVEGRDIVTEMANMRTEMIGLKSLVEDLCSELEKQTTGTDRSIHLETLLLLRSIAGTDRLSIVDAEMRRNGFQPWTPKT